MDEKWKTLHDLLNSHFETQKVALMGWNSQFPLTKLESERDMGLQQLAIAVADIKTQAKLSYEKWVKDRTLRRTTRQTQIQEKAVREATLDEAKQREQGLDDQLSNPDY